MARKRSKRWVEAGPLPRWQRLYAIWLVGRGGELAGTREDYRGRYPLSSERVEKATELSGRPVQQQLITLMEKRRDFREYFEKLQDGQFLAKEMATQRVSRQFEARDLALEKALDLKPDPESGRLVCGPDADVRAVESITRPYIDHGMPKKHERQDGVQRVTINLIGARPEDKAMILKAVSGETEENDVDFEIVEPDKLLTDGEDD